MSQHKKIIIGVVFAVILAVGLAVAAISFGAIGNSTTQTTSKLSGAPSVLIVQLTDPPTVPAGTASLNLTYASISLLVSEPVLGTTTLTSTTISSGSTVTSTITSTSTIKGQVSPTTVTITKSATIDLLQLQNISQTIASADLPSGTTIYSVTFTVTSISISVNGVTSTVSLAGGNTLLVTLARPGVLEGSTNAVLLELNPTIVNTPSGYQMIPSSVGIMRPQSEVSDQDEQVGSQNQLTNQDQSDLEHANGQVSSNLVFLSVSGSTTKLTVQVNNTGTSPVDLVAIGFHGNFTNLACSTTITSTMSNDNSKQDENSQGCEHPDEVVFIPVLNSGTSTTSSSSSSSSTTTTTTGQVCTSGQMNLVNAGERSHDENGHQLVLNPGECLTLTFSGVISFGGNTLVPSTLAGENYTVHVIASNGAEMKLDCTLPLSSTSCTAVSSNQGEDS